MPVDPNDFRKESENRMCRKVKTPMPANEDGSGYTTEDNYQWLYVEGNAYVKVSKVSNRGWSVTAYVEKDGSIELDDILEQGLNAQEAQRRAIREVSA